MFYSGTMCNAAANKLLWGHQWYMELQTPLSLPLVVSKSTEVVLHQSTCETEPLSPEALGKQRVELPGLTWVIYYSSGCGYLQITFLSLTTARWSPCHCEDHMGYSVAIQSSEVAHHTSILPISKHIHTALMCCSTNIHVHYIIIEYYLLPVRYTYLRQN